MIELEEFRKQKDVFFAKDRHSPLTAGQRKDFKGLEYFPENPGLRLEVEVEELPEKHTVEMQTSTGSVQSYTRYGTFKFNVDRQEAELTLVLLKTHEKKFGVSSPLWDFVFRTWN